MLDRYDAFDVTSKSIRSDSILSETHSSQVLSICCTTWVTWAGVMVSELIHTKANSS